MSITHQRANRQDHAAERGASVVEILAREQRPEQKSNAKSSYRSLRTGIIAYAPVWLSRPKTKTPLWLYAVSIAVDLALGAGLALCLPAECCHGMFESTSTRAAVIHVVFAAADFD